MSHLIELLNYVMKFSAYTTIRVTMAKTFTHFSEHISQHILTSQSPNFNLSQSFPKIHLGCYRKVVGKVVERVNNNIFMNTEDMTEHM